MGRNGGTRPGAGRPKGRQNNATIAANLTKEAIREHVRKRVSAELDPLIDAQLHNAKGINHFFLRDPVTKQFQKIEDAKMIEAALNAGDEGSYYWIFTKDPSTQAFTDLMNRAADKPIEAIEQHHSGSIKLTHELS